MERNKGLIIRKLAVILLAFVVSVTFTPLLGDGSYAASPKSAKKYDEKVKYIQKDANGKEKELDPEIFTEKGKVLNADELEDLGINISTEPNVPAPEMSKDIKLGGEDELLKAINAKEDGNASAKDGENIMAEDTGEEETPAVVEEEKEPVLEVEGLSDDVQESPDENGSDETVDPEEGVPEVLVETKNEVSVKADTEEKVTYDGYTVSQPNKSGYIYVNCKLTTNLIPNNGIIKILVDGSNKWESKPWNSSTEAQKYSITVTNAAINISGLSPGMHDVRISLKTASGRSTWYTPYRYIASSIYETPSSGAGQFAFYSNYFDYMSPAFDFAAISKGYKLYMDYYQNGAYAGTIGPMNYYQNAQVGGLAPSTNYQVHIYYGKVVYYQGKNYFLTGKDNGRTTYCGTFQTGAASLPKVKSVRVNATKVKKRKAGVYGWYTGYYFGSVKYYTYKIKVTVQFKKKPGLNGLYINGAWKPGNKKKYTLTLGPYANYSKPRGKKFNVYLYSAVAPGGYGGYSPMVVKTKKVG